MMSELAAGAALTLGVGLATKPDDLEGGGDVAAHVIDSVFIVGTVVTGLVLTKVIVDGVTQWVYAVVGGEGASDG